MRIDQRKGPSRPLVLLGNSAATRAVRAAIAGAAETHAKVLITGETGVGKEIVARLVHEQSMRASRAFVAVNCSGIPETLLESELFGHARGSFTGAYRDKVGLIRQAEGGTLFLDELGEMSLRMQAALLRFAETGEIQPIGSDTPARCADVRLITATHRDLRAQMAAGAFRQDLYYRLNVIHIHVPPLRERRDDIALLFSHYLAQAVQDHGVGHPTLTPSASAALLAYHWPGNVRELRNVAERLVLQGKQQPVIAEDLPPDIRDASERSVSLTTVRDVPADEDETPVTGLASPTVQRLWDRMEAGEDFWTVVYPAFGNRELTRADLAGLVDRGLRETHGSYRALVTLFNMAPSDYKRFHAFLYAQRCNLTVGPYRAAPFRHLRAGARQRLAG